MGHTKRLVRCLVGAPGPLGSSLRALLNRVGVVNRAGDPYPLPLPPSFRDGLIAVAKGLKPSSSKAGMPSGLQINQKQQERVCVKGMHSGLGRPSSSRA